MKRKLGLIILMMMLVLTLGTSVAFGHEIMLDFDQQAEAGEEVEIELSFGHFPDDFDYEHYFFESLDEGELLVVAEDGSMTELELTKQSDRYVASFTPQQEGVHWVTFNGTRGVVDRVDSDDGLQLRYYDAKAPLLVGNVRNFEVTGTSLAAEFITQDTSSFKVGEQVTMELDYLGEEVRGEDVTLVSPDGQVSQVATDAQGKVDVEFNEEGIWLLQARVVDTDSQGVDEDGNEYDRERFNTVLYIEVREEHRDDAAWQDGTYTGIGAGRGGNIELEVTVSDGVITAIEILEHNETTEISDPAFEEIPTAIKEAQSTDVELVSGATSTSQGIIEATEVALEEQEESGLPIEQIIMLAISIGLIVISIILFKNVKQQ
ncbi:DUF4198 domain-containing protein [Natroniella sulfidigena]|uniref:FMN-binding protein n=1 Tax=Natroniella sulfidigena TaxID=723921 RepID=UPI00200B6E13|nr:FMN-binding protein [Natroniella sulfidigena]MCK8817359.1 DUF4198 domain-containing protein [Natroniella sulfidigena]